MNSDLLQKLKDWRRRIANSEGIESFRVFANKVLENIAEVKPANKEELMAIKGIRDKKYAKYGEEILALINGNSEVKSHTKLPDPQIEKPLSVSTYLNFLNQQLRKFRARVQGEISSVKIKDNVVYFSLKDSEDESVINCLIWKRDYELSGTDLEVGMEVIIEGFPDVYKPSGSLTFKTSLVELVGEGALKKAYDQLKKKLDAEGLFLEERKKEIPDFPQKIGLITSETGAVIHDFQINLGRYGFNIKFMDSRVEGQLAIRDLISAIDYFSDKDIDVLVIIRGGGSLESLQAFNNEVLVRKIADFNKPVICGIGHEKDVPLASLAADKMVSTPTAVTHVLNASWQKAVHELDLNKEKIFSIFSDTLSSGREAVNDCFKTIETNFESIFEKFNQAEESLKQSLNSLGFRITELKKVIIKYPNIFLTNINRGILQAKQKISSLENLLLAHNPERQLKLGYSIVSSGGSIIKSVNQIKINQSVEVAVANGSFESEVKKINKK